MKVEFKNEVKMKRYLSYRAELEISDEDFNDFKDYLIETVDYINEVREGKTLIRERASLTAIINEEDYEVWAIFDNIVKNGENITLIDLDYEYDNFVDSLPNELRPN